MNFDVEDLSSNQKLQMSQDQFKHYDLTLVEPNFKSNLTDLIIELDYLIFQFL